MKKYFLIFTLIYSTLPFQITLDGKILNKDQSKILTKKDVLKIIR